MAHWTGHLFHEKSFWGIVAILAVLVAAFALMVFYGNRVPMEEFSVPIRYGPF